MTRPGNFIKPEGHALRNHVLALAARQQGFSLKFDRSDKCPKRLYNVCDSLESKGQIIRARHGVEKRYFTHQADAEAFMTQRQPFVTRAAPERKSFAPDARIVYPAKFRYTVIPTPSPRFAVVDRLAFQHGFN